MHPHKTAVEFSHLNLTWTHFTGDHPERDKILHKVYDFDYQSISPQSIRASFEMYGDFVYLRMYEFNRWPRLEQTLPLTALNILAKPDQIMSWCNEPSSVPTMLNTIRNHPRMAKIPVDVVNIVLDEILEKTFPFLDDVNDRITEVEQAIIHPRQSTDVRSQIFILKRVILKARRILASERDVLYRLVRYGLDGKPMQSESQGLDLYDHAIRLFDTIDTYRELVNSALDVYLSTVSNRLNEIVKTLTLATTIFLPASLAAAIYGMNFKYLPGQNHPWGFFIVLFVVALISTALVLVFRRRGWLG